NSGMANSGVFNSGVLNTGVWNAGLLNTGIGNVGSYNSGGFNPGSVNTGSFNTGDTNTGWWNTGDLNTGVGNSGDLNTGGFNRGSQNNGFFWRADGQGQFGGDYTLTIPRIGLDLAVDIPLHIPVSGSLGNISTQPFTLPVIHLSGDNLNGTVGPIVFDSIEITGPSIALLVDGPLHLALSGPGVGPVVVPVWHVGA
ncbi:pentapeptide repeat-containing protein, partial [Mycobacterium angelicum]